MLAICYSPCGVLVHSYSLLLIVVYANMYVHNSRLFSLPYVFSHAYLMYIHAGSSLHQHTISQACSRHIHGYS